MDEETLERIFDKSKESEGKNGVGVYNVQTRIRLYYGAEYGLRFESVPEEGSYGDDYDSQDWSRE